tara:strand:+ start:175 stop:2385 length:2211 start_codon:yes stop_codon:yes gene_type:complete
MLSQKNIFITILFSFQIISAQDKVRGVVQDEQTKEPIIGVNILLIGSETGTVTDINGLFELVVPDDKQPAVRLSHIGYNTREASLDSSYNGILLLTPAVIKGQEIEVVGVKSKTEMDVASAVDMLDIAEIEIQGARDIGSALRRVSSVKMDYSTSGKQTISIRGSNATDVAVFLDGVRLNDANTGVADLSTIDLNSLEQIQVIKGGNSSLFGSGAIGGVVNMESKTAEKNSVYLNSGMGQTYNDDMDLSLGATTVFGPAGLGGRYTAKARAFGGRTITTSLFANAFGGIDFSSGRLDLRGFQLNKNLQFPSGSVDSGDSLSIISINYRGSVFGTSGWKLLAGLKDWSLNQNFFSSLNEYLSDHSQNVHISKLMNWRDFEGTVQYEAEYQTFDGDKSYFNINGDPTVNHIADMKRNTDALAFVTRWSADADHPKIDFINWELSYRMDQVETFQNEYYDFPSLATEDQNIIYDVPESHELTHVSSKRLGIHIEGRGQKSWYSIFANQGNNQRLPTLADLFRFTNTESDSLIDTLLTREYLNTTELNMQLRISNPDTELPINEVSLGIDMFMNGYTSKIAYRAFEGAPAVPFNDPIAEIRGLEVTAGLRMLEDKFLVSSSATFLDISSPISFPNKPEHRIVLTGEINLDWLVISLDHVNEGEQYYIIPGIGEGIRKPRENANLNVTMRKNLLGLNWSLSYTWRNMLSKDELDWTLEESLREGFNYFEKYREIINLRVEL